MLHFNTYKEVFKKNSVVHLLAVVKRQILKASCGMTCSGEVVVVVLPDFVEKLSEMDVMSLG